VLTYPDDPSAYAVSHTYTFGAWLLVAPVIGNQDPVRQVYLPAGTWFDWFTGEAMSGGRTIDWQSADPMRMPLFARGGAIVPLLAEDAASLIDVPDALDVRVYPEGTTTFALADGTTFTSIESADRTTFAIDGTPRAVTVRVRFPEDPVTARVDDVDAAWTRDGDFVVVRLAPGAAELALWRVAPPVDPADPDAGPFDGGSATAGGCGCRSGEPTSAILLALLAVLALRMARARRALSPR